MKEIIEQMVASFPDMDDDDISMVSSFMRLSYSLGKVDGSTEILKIYDATQ